MISTLNKTIPYFKKGKVVLFIGAGLSRFAGCDPWDAIVKKMAKVDIIKNNHNIRDLTKGGLSYDEIIDFCKVQFIKAGAENKYWGIVREALMFESNKFITEYSPVINKIKTIKKPPIIMTTNIDNCLESVSPDNFPQDRIFYKSNELIKSNLAEKTIFHIHGWIYELEKSILTKNQYIERYKEQTFIDFIQYVFAEHCVIFIGYGLKDNDLNNLIYKLPRNTSIQSHYLLAYKDEYSSTMKTRAKEHYGIEIIEYGLKLDLTKELITWIESIW